MDTEAKIILAFLFNRSGKTGLTEAEVYLPLAMDLNWFSTKEAHEFVKYAMNQELLVKKEGLLYPNFSLESIKVPIGFIPSKKIFGKKIWKQQEENIIERMVTLICTQTHQSQTEIHEELKKEEKEKNLLPEVAALFIARKHSVDVSDWYDFVKKSIVEENKE